MANHSQKIPDNYSIILKEKNWKITTRLDDENNVLTNINWFIITNLEKILNPWEKIIQVDEKTYEKINSYVDNYSKNIRIKIEKLLNNLYEKSK